MNSQQLSCFIAVYEKLSFTKASEELYLSVPTVAHHIKSLEFELNTTLFIRDNHKVSITDDGKAFYDEARNILKIENNFKNRLMRNENGEKIKIVCTSHSELHLISLILKELSKSLANLRPEIYVKPYSEAIYMLKERSVDLMLGSNNMIIDEDNLILKEEVKQQSYILINKDNPLASKDNICFKDLDNIDLIKINEKLVPFYSTNKIKEFLSIHSSHHNDFICEDENICACLVNTNLGVSILPAYRLPKLIGKKLVINNIKDNESYKYGIITLKNNNSDIINKFIKEFKAQIKTYEFNSKI